MSEVSIYIRTLMRERGLKKSFVEDRAGLGNNYLWRLKRGITKQPGREQLRAIADVIGGSVHDMEMLLDGTADDAYALARMRLQITSAQSEELDRLAAMPGPENEFSALARELYRKFGGDSLVVRALRSLLGALRDGAALL